MSGHKGLAKWFKQDWVDIGSKKKGGKAKKKVKNAKLAAMYGDPNKITRGDIITAAKRKTMKKPKRRA